LSIEDLAQPFSALEFGVLNTLAAHPAAPVSRADLIREVWGTSHDGGSNTVDVVILRLRRKLGAVGERIETVRGVGHRLR
jgi:two-component system alkaline phosphatase synthesis response regulator PhoP